MKYQYGCNPSPHDERDHPFTALHVGAFAPHLDLTPALPPVYDQKQLSSCIGNGVSTGFDTDYHKQHGQFITPSRLFVYYNLRAYEGTINQDGGGNIRDGLKSVQKLGVCKESTWAYSHHFNEKPSPNAFHEAASFKAVSYQRVDQTLNGIKATLSDGFPIVFGIRVYESFESSDVARTGVVPMPGAHENEVGGHCVVICGYDDASKRIIGRNSWGGSWGQHGNFTMPYEYVLNRNLAYDLYVIKSVS